MGEEPLVSVIIPVYNSERYLAEAIQSVFDQAHQPLEVIVVDDGSTDGSAAVAERFAPRVQCLRQPHEGSGPARNRGVEASKGAYLALLDADDLWAPNSLPRRLAAFEADSALDIVCGQVQQFHSPELSPELAQQVRCPPGLIPGYVFGAMVVKRSAFDRVGPIDSRWTVVEGVDWVMRAQEAGLRFQMLPDLVLRRRLHQSNLGRVVRQTGPLYAQVLKAALDRRRAANRAPADSPAGQLPDE